MHSPSLFPIKGFMETSFLDWPGKVCSTIFLPYCNLRCPYCYNHQLVLRPDELETLALDDILERLIHQKDLPQEDRPQEDHVDAICITGGEPTMHRELPELLEKIRGAGFKTKLDTNGTQPEILDYLLNKKLLDCVAMDVKAPLDDMSYERCAGVHLPASIIMESIRVLARSPVSTILRCTVCPSLLEQDDIYRLAKEIGGLWSEEASDHKALPPFLTLQQFSPKDPMDPALKEIKPLEDEFLERMQEKVNDILHGSGR
ncbi:MAG: anaerobic ribonucleoside-triphosphate reductase activating protein [Deltaproteobacteria bacterium]|nr:anaerobic ribonucleoside-triphosphate reductase activating protein [Deltaproteobacteria bacterium]